MHRARIEFSIVIATVLSVWSADSRAEDWPLLGDLMANGGRNYAAVFCETQTLFDTQAKQNEILVSRGQNPVYTANLTSMRQKNVQ